MGETYLVLSGQQIVAVSTTVIDFDNVIQGSQSSEFEPQPSQLDTNDLSKQLTCYDNLAEPFLFDKELRVASYRGMWKGTGVGKPSGQIFSIGQGPEVAHGSQKGEKKAASSLFVKSTETVLRNKGTHMSGDSSVLGALL